MTTQIHAYDPISDISYIEIPEHQTMPESKQFNFYDLDLSQGFSIPYSLYDIDYMI